MIFNQFDFYSVLIVSDYDNKSVKTELDSYVAYCFFFFVSICRVNVSFGAPINTKAECTTD